MYDYAFHVLGAIFVYSFDPYQVRRNARAKVVRNKGEGPPEPQSLGTIVPIVLMRICRQIHSECSEILYGGNVFRLYASNADFAPRYSSLIRHILFSTDSMIQKVFDDDLATVEYWWRRHFWPDVTDKSTRLLQTFPHVETLTFPMKSNRRDKRGELEPWRPAFMASGQKTREQRIALAAAWLKVKCPFANERLRRCLQLDIVPPAVSSKYMYKGSRFDPEDEWDCSEFAEAFKKMKFS